MEILYDMVNKTFPQYVLELLELEHQKNCDNSDVGVKEVSNYDLTELTTMMMTDPEEFMKSIIGIDYNDGETNQLLCLLFPHNKMKGFYKLSCYVRLYSIKMAKHVSDWYNDGEKEIFEMVLRWHNEMSSSLNEEVHANDLNAIALVIEAKFYAVLLNEPIFQEDWYELGPYLCYYANYGMAGNPSSGMYYGHESAYPTPPSQDPPKADPEPEAEDILHPPPVDSRPVAHLERLQHDTEPPSSTHDLSDAEPKSEQWYPSGSYQPPPLPLLSFQLPPSLKKVPVLLTKESFTKDNHLSTQEAEAKAQNSGPVAALLHKISLLTDESPRLDRAGLNDRVDNDYHPPPLRSSYHRITDSGDRTRPRSPIRTSTPIVFPMWGKS
jgi:hypothetical protein